MKPFNWNLALWACLFGLIAVVLSPRTLTPCEQIGLAASFVLVYHVGVWLLDRWTASDPEDTE